jgi:hypothetical protein
MSTGILERTYGHHHSRHMRSAVAAITANQPNNVSLIVLLVEPENGSRRRQKT